MRFAPECGRSVLAGNFEGAKRIFLMPFMAVHLPHLVMPGGSSEDLFVHLARRISDS